MSSGNAPEASISNDISAHQILHDTKKLPHQIVRLKIDIGSGRNATGILEPGMSGEHDAPEHMKIVCDNPHILVRAADERSAKRDILGRVRGLILHQNTLRRISIQNFL